MREFEYLFDRGVTRGIRTSSRLRTSTQTLTDAYNLQCDKDGLNQYEPIILEPEWVKVQTWNWPRIFVGSIYAFLITNEAGTVNVYIIDSNRVAILKHTFPYGVVNYVDVADFGRYTVFATDYGVLYRNDNTYTFDIPGAPGQLYPQAVTCCNFRGQLVMGNMVGIYPPSTGHMPPYSWKLVAWSNIGDTNMLPDSRNEAGSMYIDDNGTVLRTLPLSDHVIVYTTDGIWALTPVTDPAPTFAKTRIYSAGIIYQTSVAGDGFTHVAVLSTGEVVSITNDLKVNVLGYKELFSGKQTIVNFDQRKRRWHISTPNTSYLLTEFGLTRSYQSITGVVGKLGYFAGVESSDLSAYITTDQTDFGMKGIKTVHGVEVGGDIPHSPSAEILVRYDASTSDWISSGEVPLNAMGTMGKPMAGNDFKFKIKCSSFANVKLDYLKVRWKMSDLRGLRGVYSPPIRGQYVG